MIPWAERKHQRVHHCPACGATLAVQPAGTPLRCASCTWRLITLAEWQQLPPSDQGYVMYTQAAWPTSPLARVKNPYAKASAEWKQFEAGELRAVMAAQDGEE
jgi:hypothetical protein